MGPVGSSQATTDRSFPTPGEKYTPKILSDTFKAYPIVIFSLGELMYANPKTSPSVGK